MTALHAFRSRAAGHTVGIAAALVALALMATSASAASPAPGWTVDSVPAPTNFSINENAKCEAEVALHQPTPLCDVYQVDITNAGAAETNGTSVTITDKLPTGLIVQKIDLFAASGADIAEEAGCATVAQVVTCVLPEGADSSVAPDGTLELNVYVTVPEPEVPGPLLNGASVSGGGAPEASASSENHASSAPPAFGPTNFSSYIGAQNGTRDTQAGDHPYELTTTIDLASTIQPLLLGGNGVATSVNALKDVVVNLPLGFAGSTLAAPECTLTELSANKGRGCPNETVVGHIETELAGLDRASNQKIESPIWNLTPERGVPGEFGFVDGDENAHVFYVHVVPTPEGYVLQATNIDIPQAVLSHIVVTFYGEPAVRDSTGRANVPFFTNPTDCSGANLTARIWVDSWQNPGAYNPDGTPDLEGDPAWVKAESASPPVTGCDELSFGPELKAQPTEFKADSPSGLEFELKLPQTELAAVHATPALKNATVTLPEGVTVDPSSGSGLQACSEAQIGWPATPGNRSPFNFNADPPACPEGSKIGSLELETPLIPGVLTGAIYLAAQDENPFGSTLAAYVVVNDPATGVVLKIPGEIKADPSTGRLTTYFPENAQLPFSDLKLHFFGGPRASLATPESCGAFTTTSDLEPWSAPGSGPNAAPFDTFNISQGCVSGFNPFFVGGTTNLQAGAFTSFVASFSREDSDQELAGVTVSLPPGLLANVGSVPLCPDTDASAGTCPESSQVGTVLALAGPGPNPLSVPGRAYLTGPYNGGPYGLSVVVPAVAGPFNFGNVVVRQSLRIDPGDAHVTDVSDPFPTILDVRGANGETSGIPIKLRRVDVSINRPGFTFNPTNCSKLQVGGAITSTRGASSVLATPFQVTNCASLTFAPKFSVSTSGKASKALGASLTARVTYPRAPQGTYANIAKVKVELPKQLPSRLTTLQKACTSKQFESNPAGCPPESKIGFATVRTPILPGVLQGPAIFVSHGGEAFPSLTIVLQGDGVTIDLVGATEIKNGVTSTTFKTVPDSPFSTFELTLPQGQFSALAANGNLCHATSTKTVKKKVTVRVKGLKKTVTRKVKRTVVASLVMPNEFVAQNGVVLKQDSTIAVTGCHKAKKASKAKKKHKGKGGKKH